MNSDFLVDINEEPTTIVINDRWGVSGALEVKIEQNVNPDWTNANQDFIITGVLKTSFYERNITKIESRRYIIDGIEVLEEQYESTSEDILYKFKSDNFRVKYQIAEVVDVQALLAGEKDE